MPDHYATLEIQPTATQEQITEGYHRMAMIHHPDRNRNDTTGATSRFQQIQKAYELLSNPLERCRYDMERHAESSTGDQFSLFRDLADFIGVPWPQREGFYESLFRALGEEEEEARQKAREQLAREEEERRAKRREAREQRRREEQIREREQKERYEREEKERRAAERAREAEIEKARELVIEGEARKQHARWQLARATTQEAKRSTCWHSSSCVKTQHRKKFKCEACGARRGITAFECPHCGSNICQLCFAKSAEKRAHDEESEPTKPKPTKSKSAKPKPANTDDRDT
ncbi:DnaJ domain-containing protein [Nemania abortiva]|nr:DnaJ domain-containing protein [Nemania abortiva]